MEFFYLFYLLIFYIGLKTSYTDLLYFKIKNSDLIQGFLLGLLLFFLSYFFSSNEWSFYSLSIINFLISLIFGILFWSMNFWSSADGKLFSLFVFLTPITIYELGSIDYFPAFTFVINTFLILILIMFYQIIIKGKYKDYKTSFFSSIKLENFSLAILATFFMIHWLLKYSINSLSWSEFILLAGFIFLFAGKFLKDILSKSSAVIFFLVLLRLYLDETIYSFNFIVEFLLILLIYLFLVFFQKIPDIIFSNSYKLNEIKKGMILKYPIVKKGKLYFQFTEERVPKEILENKKTDFKIIISKKSRGLSFEEHKKLLSLRKSGKFKGRIEILEHTCFAPYLFAGIILTILIKGNVIIWIKTFL